MLVPVLLCLCIGSAVGLDFGFTVDNQTGVSVDGGAEFLQTDKLGIWFKTAIGDTLSFDIEGSYTFDLDRYWLFDVDQLRLDGTFPIVRGERGINVGFSFGRFHFREFTGLVLAHQLDGLKLQLGLPFMVIGTSIGYSGLYQKPTSSVLMSNTDIANFLEESLFFSSPRLVETLEVRFPELIGRFDLIVSGVFQQDLWEVLEPGRLIQEGTTTYDEEKGGALHTVYGGLGLSGPIITNLFLKVFGYFGAGTTLSFVNSTYTYQPILSFLAGTEVSYYLPKVLFSFIQFQFVFTSGDSDFITFREGNTSGSATMFTSISRPSIGIAFSPQLGNIFFAKLTYSIKPFSMLNSVVAKNFQVQVGGVPSFRATTGPISEASIDDASTSLYLGTEVFARINVRITSDLGTYLQTGLFIPNPAMFQPSTTRFKGRLGLSLSF